MILIIESGSTKSDCALLNERGEWVEHFETMGFNPYFHGAELVNRKISEVPRFKKFAPQVTRVFFYGAGCSSPKMCLIVESGLKKAFPNARVRVDHDMIASAYATYAGKPEISCILGTGSNSCYFDGQTVREEVPALAYILGDEGSASYLGKKLLAAYLYKLLPPHVERDFIETFHLSKEEIFDKVYNQPHANVFLANFAQFVGKYREEPFFREMVRQGFSEFVRIHVLCYHNAREVEVNFVGSIAHHFSEELLAVLKENGLTHGRTIQRPLEGLVNYHLNYLKILENAEA